MPPPLVRQLYASIGFFCLLFSAGYMTGIQSILLASLKKPESPIKLSLEQESWIPSITVLMMFPAQCLCGIMTDRYGRKYVLAACLVPIQIAFFIFFYASDFIGLFIASLIAGLFGGGLAIGTLFVAEICSPRNRGTILNIKGAFFALGVATPHFLGNYYDYKTLVLYGTIFSLLGILTTLTSPESPPWLAGQGRFEECKEAFTWFRGTNEHEELNKLIESQKRDIKRKTSNLGKENRFVQFFRSISDRAFLLALSINILGLLVVEMTGRPIFSIYAIDIINSITNKSANPYFYALGMDLADIMAACLSCILIRKLARRTLLFGAGGLAVCLLFIFCLMVFLLSKKVIPDEFSWVSLIVVGTYFFVTTSGVANVIFTLLGEVFPLHYRGMGISVSSFVFGLLLFFGIKLTPGLIRAMGIHGTFLMHAIIMAFCLVFLYFLVPDTTDRALQDIEDEIRGEVETVVIPPDEKEKMLA